jgi:hypothetical protein
VRSCHADDTQSPYHPLKAVLSAGSTPYRLGQRGVFVHRASRAVRSVTGRFERVTCDRAVDVVARAAPFRSSLRLSTNSIARATASTWCACCSVRAQARSCSRSTTLSLVSHGRWAQLVLRDAVSLSAALGVYVEYVDVPPLLSTATLVYLFACCSVA